MRPVDEHGAGPPALDADRKAGLNPRGCVWARTTAEPQICSMPGRTGQETESQPTRTPSAGGIVIPL